MTLSPKRRRFIDEYLLDLNPRAAAERAGYAAAVGYNLLYKPEVAAALREAMDERARHTGITKERVVRELGAIAFADVRNVVSWNVSTPEGARGERDELKHQVRVKDSHLIDSGTAAAICEVRRYSWGAVRVKMHDKLAALALLCRHLGMFNEPAEAGGFSDGSARMRELTDRMAQLTRAQRDALRDAIRKVIEGPA